MYKFYNKIFVQPPGCIKHLLLAMKLTALLLTIGILQVSAATYAQKVTLKDKNMSLKEVFNQIRQQSGYDFIITSDLLSQAKPVTIEVSNADLKDALDKIFDEQPLNYTIQEKTVIVSKKEESFLDKLKNKIKAELAQITVTASVHDELGQPMAGVTVRQKDANNITVTDAKGNFSITVPDNNSTAIAFSYVGYETQELRARDIPNGSVITLKVAENNLKEVVINKGYYNEKQELSTGNVTVVNAKTIGEQPVSDPILAIEGRVPGLIINQTSGYPGSYATIKLRGQNSLLNGNDPLYIIDGVPFSAQSLSSPGFSFGPVGGVGSANFSNGNGLSPFNGLNPTDIENIEVLKDADATAIYGSRGANGVILITTKKGKAGNTRFDLNVSSGAGTVPHFMDLLNTQQYLNMRRQAFVNDGLPHPSIATDPANSDYDINGAWDTTRYTNWQKVLIGNTAGFTNIQGSLSGGNANTQFVVGGGYTRQGTVLLGDFNDQKAAAHLNLTHSSTDQRFNVQFVASYVNDNNILPGGDFSQYTILPPDAPSLYDAGGNINWQMVNGTATNLPNVAGQAEVLSTSVTNNLISNLNLRYLVLPGLQVSGSFGYNHDQMEQTQLTPASSYPPPLNTFSTVRDNTFGTSEFSSWIIEPQLSYRTKWSKGKLELLVGSSFQQNQTKSITQDASDFVTDALIANPQSAASLQILGSTNTIYRYTALYGRIGYDWDEKYVLNLTARRDGSSRFGPGKQFGNFGAAGVAWIFSKEKYIRDHFAFLSFGKLRASYGVTGNDQIPDYQYLSTYTSGPTSYESVTGLAPSRLTNPYFAWEVVRKLEGGIELGFLNDRIMLSADYYRNRTANQLVGLPLPVLTGFATVQYNLPAVVQNTGVELTLATVNIKSSSFEWSSSVNFTIPNNKLVSFPDLANFPAYKSRWSVGRSIFNQALYHTTGVDPQTGLYTFATANANGLPGAADLTFNTSLSPKYYGGWQNSFSYKRFTLDIFIQYVNKIGKSSLASLHSPAGIEGVNQLTTVLAAAWKSPGDASALQRYGTESGPVPNYYQYWASSDAALENSSFLRFKTLAFAYQFPGDWIKKAHLQNARLYIQCQNLFTITGYKGLDPETAGSIGLPPLRVITTGFQIGL